MMGYFYLALVVLVNVTKGYCGKRTSGYLTESKDALRASLMRMGLCILVGAVSVVFGTNPAECRPSLPLLLITALSGIATATNVVAWMLCVRKNSYMLTDVFSMLGLLIPIVLSNLLFREAIRPIQWCGLAFLILATLIMCSYNHSIKAKLTLSSLALLIINGSAAGLTDFSQKLFVKTLPDVPAEVFSFYTYIFAALAMLIAFAFFKSEPNRTEKTNFTRIFWYIFVMAVCLFANSYFKTLAAEELDAVLLYPLSQGAVMIFSAAMAALFFKEKITPKSITALCIAFVGLLLINVL